MKVPEEQHTIQTWEENLFFASSNLQWLLAFIGFWMHHSHLRLHDHVASSSSVFVCLCLLLFYVGLFPIRTLATGYQVHLNDPRWSQLKILNLVKSALFFQIKSHSQVPGIRTYIFWGHYSTHYRPLPSNVIWKGMYLHGIKQKDAIIWNVPSLFVEKVSFVLLCFHPGVMEAAASGILPWVCAVLESMLLHSLMRVILLTVDTNSSACPVSWHGRHCSTRSTS